jgi:salicylate hydroxylase
MAARARWLLTGACAADTTLHWSRAQEIDTRFSDGSGRVLFVGDAAHAMAPTLGQGATMAIEDGAALVNLLREQWNAAGLRRERFDVPALVHAFTAMRSERVAFAKRFSWDASDTLRPGTDAVAGNRAKNGAAYRAGLAKLYLDTPLRPDVVPAQPA